MSKADEETIWKTLYRIATGFPDATKLSQERLRGYYTFFDSLRYTLPSTELRKHWMAATASGDSELTWEGFSRVRSSKEVIRWLFYVQDQIRVFQGKKTIGGYAERYVRLMKPGTNKIEKHGVNMTIAMARLKSRIKSRTRSMDEFLQMKIPDYLETTSHKRKLKLRQQYLDDAAAYYWKQFTDLLNAGNSGFNKRTVNERTQMILEAFDEKFMLRPHRIVNRVKRIPSAVINRILR